MNYIPSMFAKFMDWFVRFFVRSARHVPILHIAIVILVLGPFVVLSFFDYREAEQNLTELILSRRESLAQVASIALKEKFDRVVDVGISFVTRIQFRKFVETGMWNDAIRLLENAPKDFPYIDTVGLFDPGGTVMAVAPPIPEAIGQNFAYRDYYQGVSKDWQPYISEVFKRAPEPRYNVVSVAIPIRSDALRESDKKILGILLLTIKLDTILDWAREIKVGSAGFTYFVDRKGHPAGHPKFSSYDDIVDFSEVPVVQKILSGKKGVEVLYNPVEQEERISAYEQVPVYGWGVIVQEPTYAAFAPREARLRQLAIAYGIAFAVICIFLYLLFHFIRALSLYQQQEKIFLESVGDGLIAIDRYWNITLWNKVASSLTGWSEKDALGNPFREIVKFVRERDKSEAITFIEETMLYGKTHLMEPHTMLVRKDGSLINVGDSAAPIFDQKGRVSGAIIVFRDISQQHELEKAREEFASLATHQLRTPLTAIKGYSAMLLEGLLTQEQKEQLLAIKSANERLLNLVNAMLNVSRAELGTLAIEPEPVYIPDIAEAVVNEFRPRIQVKKLELTKRYAENLPSVNADPKLMRVIIQNLLSNAINYTPAGGRIQLEIEKRESDIMITVSDTGIGIPREQQSKIFEKLFRADNARETAEEGTGLGLYMVRSVVEQSGGKIWFESEENKGTAFHVAIPLSGMKKREGTKGLT